MAVTVSVCLMYAVGRAPQSVAQLHFGNPSSLVRNIVRRQMDSSLGKPRAIVSQRAATTMQRTPSPNSNGSFFGAPNNISGREKGPWKKQILPHLFGLRLIGSKSRYFVQVLGANQRPLLLSIVSIAYNSSNRKQINPPFGVHSSLRQLTSQQCVSSSKAPSTRIGTTKQRGLRSACQPHV